MTYEKKQTICFLVAIVPLLAWLGFDIWVCIFRLDLMWTVLVTFPPSAALSYLFGLITEDFLTK